MSGSAKLIQKHWISLTLDPIETAPVVNSIPTASPLLPNGLFGEIA